MIHYSHIIKNSHVDGPGVRTVLFLQGCSIRCKGCQNPHLWPAQGGKKINPVELARLLVSITPHKNLTIVGGEPFDQPYFDLYCLFKEIRRSVPDMNIIVYTGYTWEQLSANFRFPVVAKYIDILVDGPFIARQDDSLITWRGSRNQRPINVQETIKAGYLALENWDHPEIVVDAAGNLHLPIGLAPDFSGTGTVQKSRRCGEST